MNTSMLINKQAGYMVLWGGVIALAMMRVAPSLYYTPIYLVSLLALFDRESRLSLLDFARHVPVLLAYFLLAGISVAWAEFPDMTWKEWRGDILIPCLAFIASFHFCRAYGRQRFFEYMLLAAWGSFLIGCAAAYLLFHEEWMNHVFNGIGYFSTYLFMLSSASLPFLTRYGRLAMYPLVAALLFVTQQRVAWVLFPVIGLADVVLHGRAYFSKGKLLLIAAVLLGFSYGMMKVVISDKAPDAFHPEAKAKTGDVIEHMASNERLRAWQQWLERGKESPALGAGFGRDNVKAHFSAGREWPEEWLHHGHNVFLNTFLQLGLAGLAVFLAAYFQLARYLVRHWQKCSAAALTIMLTFLLRNMFDDFNFKRLLIVYAMLLGACLAQVVPLPPSAATAKQEP